ncbi:MAG: sensor histidine kinase [Solirubrobacteraceae bacterium]
MDAVQRIEEIDLRVVDRVLAVALTVGAIVDASSQPHLKLGAVAVVSLVVLTASVAWRRVSPVVAVAVAVTGFAAFEIASGYNGDGALEVAAIALNFYTLGRLSRGGMNVLRLAALFGYWLLGAAVVTYVPGSGSVGAVLGPWALFGALPFAVGRTLATRSALTCELEAAAARLRDEQEVRAREAAVEERNRMARELHDVIAHCVSVMVVQTSGARRVASRDVELATEALRVVEGAGREALVELRRIVGVLRRGSDQLAGSAAPGLAQLGALADRSRAAGLPVELNVEGHARGLSPGLDLVAYRVAQEALTNAIKHAGPARAHVSVSVGARELELEVSDTGRGPVPDGDGGGSGHGLVGMGERVSLYGGQLRAGARAGGGFEVSARIPLDGIVSSPRALASPAGAGAEDVMVDARAGLRWPWLDTSLAGALLVVLEIAALSAGHRRGPLAVNVIVVAGLALAAVWRRRSPLWFLVVVEALAEVMNSYLIALTSAPIIAAYVLLVPAYTVAAWANRRSAVAGLATFLAGAAIGELVVHHGKVGNFTGAALTLAAAWAAGRAIRSRRVLNSELERTSVRLAAEREDRARLAVAGERSRIARELHAVVARSVAAMVVQAEAALSLLNRDRVQADAAMSAIENTGRDVLAEMRRILGVLRHQGDGGELAPQPGVDQIYTLIERARERGQLVELAVNGDPGTLPAGVDLGLYRILEDALQSARQQQVSALGVSLRFGEQDLELRLTARCHGPSSWPTSAMRERLALCGGQLDPDPDDQDGWRFSARMPRGLQGALG